MRHFPATFGADAVAVNAKAEAAHASPPYSPATARARHESPVPNHVRSRGPGQNPSRVRLSDSRSPVRDCLCNTPPPGPSSGPFHSVPFHFHLACRSPAFRFACFALTRQWVCLPNRQTPLRSSNCEDRFLRRRSPTHTPSWGLDPSDLFHRLKAYHPAPWTTNTLCRKSAFHPENVVSRDLARNRPPATPRSHADRRANSPAATGAPPATRSKPPPPIP